MMKINGMDGTNTQAGTMGMAQPNDPVGKNIKNQIALAQKKLQELSSNKEMSAEDKMKKRQEIQQEITSLNQQLRQHQMEQRKEKQSDGTTMDDMLGGSRKTAKPGQKGSGLTQANMQALISADTSMQQAEVQGSVATQMEGRARILKSEIKMDSARGADTEDKQEALAGLEAQAQEASAGQLSALAEAGKEIEESVKEDKDDAKDKKAEKAPGSETAKEETEADPYPAVDVLL